MGNKHRTPEQKYQPDLETPAARLGKIKSSLEPKNIITYLSCIEKNLQLFCIIPIEIKEIIQFYYNTCYLIEDVPRNSEDAKKIDLTFSTFELGASKCGRSEFLRRFVLNEYRDYTAPTDQSELRVKIIKFEHLIIRWRLFDINPMRSWNFVNIPLFYYKQGHGLFFIFSIDDKSSFEYIKMKIHSFNQDRKSGYCLLKSVILIGMKCDLEHKREIPKDEAIRLANDGDMKYIEVSAKENINIECAHVLMLKSMIDQMNEENVYVTMKGSMIQKQ